MLILAEVRETRSKKVEEEENGGNEKPIENQGKWIKPSKSYFCSYKRNTTEYGC
jgi:hypothetical protein